MDNLFKKLGVGLPLPRYCHLCGAPSTEPVCTDCTLDFMENNQGCRVCDLPLSTENQICSECQTRLPNYDKAICAYVYNNNLSHLIHQLKNQRNYHWVDLLLNKLLERIEQYYDKTELPDALVPVPLHWRKFLKRGYNQSAVIAQCLGSELKLPVKNLVKKTVYSTPQHTLKRNERLKNLRDTFSVSDDLTGKHLAIVDDVMTTGVTAEILVKALKEKGASKVDVWTLARTPKLR